MSKVKRKRPRQGNSPRLTPPPRPSEKTSVFRRAGTWIFLFVAAGFLVYGASQLLDNSESADRPDGDVASGASPGGADGSSSPVAPTTTTADAATIRAPGLRDPNYVAPLTDAYRRIDPANDGWQSEAFNEAVGAQLKKLSKLFSHPENLSVDQLALLASEDFTCPPLRPSDLREVFSDGSFRVHRHDGNVKTDHRNTETTLRGSPALAAAVRQFAGLYGDGKIERVKLKLFTVDAEQTPVSTRVYFQSVGPTDEGVLQVNGTWNMRWTSLAEKKPRLTGIDVEKYEAVLHPGAGDDMFADCTESVLGETDAYRRQFLYPTDHWRARIPRDLGLDVVANHGLAVGDVNGDGLDDLYVCQQGGLPNRLLIQNLDGTLRDATADSGADWLDYCASALLIDLDNDGDRDLVVAQEWKILLMSNDGSGRFQLEFGTSSRAQTFSISSADYDLDGKLDIYTCGYNPPGSDIRRGALGEPMPYHDANNGGENMLLRNASNWLFDDVTDHVGLNENNTRHSFAASWEDYDNDGDPDLYVANDYGRNNLYRNDGGRFTDVAAELGVEDMSAGMSACWSDYNRDGWMDLYVSNMFSAAGNRITYQRQFKTAADQEVRRQYQRHARGNTLFESTGDGQFRDVSETAGVTMGRWAWGSRFVDINSDGWDDLVVANGFISTADTGDL